MNLYIDKKNKKTIYNIIFSSITDLYNYLKSDPSINKDVFKEISSIKNNSSFYGDSYSRSVEYLKGGYNKGFDNFLKSAEILREANLDYSDNRDLIKSIYGGIPLASLVASGIPECMLRYDRRKDAKVRNIYFSLSYSCGTVTEQVINRGLAMLYILDALEKNGDIINFKANEISFYDSEIVNIEVVLKKPGDAFLNLEKCYFPFVGKEFLRRLLFRVLECTPVQFYGWQSTYGRVMTVEQAKEFMGLKEGDLFIPEPKEIGITGDSIYEDSVKLINYLGLNTEFDVEKVKRIEKNRIRYD